MTDGAEAPPSATEWPVELRGVTETVVTTIGPNDLWNVAALGVHAPEDGGAATATTWGNTRTRRNFHREGGGYVQFATDPVVFADATLSIREEPDPVLEAADAWAQVEATHVDTDETENGTRRQHWELRPVESDVVEEAPRTINRGFNAVVEATVAASRLDVPAYDTETLRERLRYFESVVESAGSVREREAMARVREHADGDW
ncbi:DUF447 domain-containing protein [Halobacterium bonnevillei]|uniref:DUF447 family protein n=1 Tax=Halobacterium bonnevillei TaxID=2692200 RepID=A0A6B0SSP1_9EURY|nr:DUF447 domain-containing protein [Halobacterium bonnevillei]MXR22573.1 DUF447 family protein [Halobacterium bonnevillei]